VLYPPGQTAETSREENQQEMVTSQESATVAALRELRIPVPTTLTVHSVDAGTPVSTLREGDVILAVDGRTIDSIETLNGIMKKVTPGDVVRVTVQRNGAETTVSTPTRRWEDGRTILGIRVDPNFKPPFEVTIRIGNVGGPSAGTMFALGIIDVLTPGDLTGGEHIAGTGTITEYGEVGAIGGIGQKMVGARRAGARWFLAPSDNCGEVTGHVPDGLRVVRIHTLHEARLAVDHIAAGSTAALPTCSS
jgi:PDZ domain-containing protein